MWHTAAGAVQGWRAHGSSRNRTADTCQKSPDARPEDEALANLEKKKKSYKPCQMAVLQHTSWFLQNHDLNKPWRPLVE